MRDVRTLELVVKGFANHWRITMLEHLEKCPGLSLWELAEDLNVNIKTASEHLRRLAAAGLITKRYRGRIVQHTVSPLGRSILIFLRKLE